MNFNSRKSSKQHADRWRVVLSGWVCILALMLQVILPTSAHASGGFWVEICGEFGAETVLMDVAGDETLPVDGEPCADCGPCVLCAAASPAVFSDIAVTGVQYDIVSTRYSEISADLPPNEAQFWPDNRGPPLRHVTTNLLELPSMIPTRISTGGAGS